MERPELLQNIYVIGKYCEVPEVRPRSKWRGEEIARKLKKENYSREILQVEVWRKDLKGINIARKILEGEVIRKEVKGRMGDEWEGVSLMTEWLEGWSWQVKVVLCIQIFLQKILGWYFWENSFDQNIIFDRLFFKYKSPFWNLLNKYMNLFAVILLNSLNFKKITPVNFHPRRISVMLIILCWTFEVRWSIWTICCDQPNNIFILLPVFQFQEQFLVRWFMEAWLQGETACVSGNRLQHITFYFSCVNTRFLSQIYCNQQSNQMLIRKVFDKMYWKMSISSTENNIFFQRETQLTVLNATRGTIHDVTIHGTGHTPRSGDADYMHILILWTCWYIDVFILWIYQHYWSIVTMVLLILWIY